MQIFWCNFVPFLINAEYISLYTAELLEIGHFSKLLSNQVNSLIDTAFIFLCIYIQRFKLNFLRDLTSSLSERRVTNQVNILLSPGSVRSYFRAAVVESSDVIFAKGISTGRTPISPSTARCDHCLVS